MELCLWCTSRLVGKILQQWPTCWKTAWGECYNLFIIICEIEILASFSRMRPSQCFKLSSFAQYWFFSKWNWHHLVIYFLCARLKLLHLSGLIHTADGIVALIMCMLYSTPTTQNEASCAYAAPNALAPLLLPLLLLFAPLGLTLLIKLAFHCLRDFASICVCVCVCVCARAFVDGSLLDFFVAWRERAFYNHVQWHDTASRKRTLTRKH